MINRRTAGILISIMFCLMLIIPSIAEPATPPNQVVIPAGTTQIADEAFFGDQSLTKVVLPEGLLSIGAKAFAGTSLTSVVLPQSLSYFAEDAFDGCPQELEIRVYPNTDAADLCGQYGIQAIILANTKVGIIHLDPSESGYREANVKDLKATFTEENGYDATFVTAATPDKQLKAAQDFISDGVDCILICAAESTGWDDVLQAAKDAGIRVFLFDRMIDSDASLYTAAVISDMAEEGRTAVNWLKSLNLEEYRILHIQGQLGSSAQIGRSAALNAKVASDSQWTIVRQGTGGDSWDPREARKIAEAVIDSGEYFNIVYAENDSMAQGVVDALDAAGITHGVDGDVIVMGFDCNKWSMQKLLDGEWNYDGQCSPFQAAPIDRMIKTLAAGGTITGLNSRKQFFTPEIGFDARTITQDDIDRYGLEGSYSGSTSGGGSGNEMPKITVPEAGGIEVGIIHLEPAESSYREANVRNLQATFTLEKGYSAYFATAATHTKQLKVFRYYIEEGVNYILLCPAESSGWDEALTEAYNAGIKVILYDRVISTNPEVYTAAVVSDMALEGQIAVDWLESLNLDEYRILHIQGQLGSSAQIGRSAALESKVDSNTNWTMVRQGTGGDSWDPDEARKITQAAIDAGEDFNIAYVESDYMARGVEDALDAAGITHGVNGDVIIIGFDCNKWAMRKLLAGTWNYDVQCSPFQATYMDQIIKMLEAGGTITGLDSMKYFYIPEVGFDARTITQDDINCYGLGD